MSAKPIPDHIGPYRVLRPLGRGGMSEVYEVEDNTGGEHLALKLLFQTGGAIPRFNREYEALIRLNHPSIVRVYNYGLLRGRPWFTMELLDGQSLQTWIKSHGKPGTDKRAAEVLRLGYFIADALYYIHRRGLVHRDLKSANVVVLPDGRVKLLDFGTTHLDDAVDQITLEGEFVGTFSYASPEQLEGNDVDHRADIYCMGVLLYRLVTGRRPFEAKNPAELARLHINVAPRPPRELVPSVPEDLEKLVLWMMEKDRDKRPKNAREVATRLERMATRPLSVPGMGVAIRTDKPVGRERQLHELLASLDDPVPGAAHLVIGGPGSDRVRLTETVAAAARNRGWRVVTSSLRRGRDLHTVARLLCEVAETFDAEASPSARTGADALRMLKRRDELEHPSRRQVLRLAGATLLVERVRADGKPMLVLLQHLHRAGPITLELLVGLRRAAQDAQAPVVFVAGCAQDADSPVRQRFPDGRFYLLEPLNVRDTALAIGALLYRRPPPEALARLVHEACGGQPAFLEEVVRMLVDAGRLGVRGADGNRVEWLDAGIEPIPIPPTAREAIRVDLGSLPAMHRRFLEALALLGGEAERVTLAAGLGWSDAEAQVIVEALHRGGWVGLVVGHPGRLRCARPLVTRVLEEELPQPRRNLLGRFLSTNLGAEPVGPAEVELLLACGQLGEAVQRARMCADHLLDEQRPFEALAVLDQVVERLEGVPDDELTALGAEHLYLLHANSLLMVRPIDPNMARSLGRAGELSTSRDVLARVELARARLQGVLGHYPNRRKFLADAWELAVEESSPQLRSTVACFLCEGCLQTGKQRSAVDWLDKATEAVAEIEESDSTAYVTVLSGTLCRARGALVEAEAAAAEAMQYFERRGNARGLWTAVCEWAHALRLQGRFSEGLSVLYQHLPDARRSEMTRYYTQLLMETAWNEVDLCRLGRAQECVDELEATIRRGEQLILRLEAKLVRGRILLASGQYVEAAAALKETYASARRAELVVIGEHARALMGETLVALGEKEDGAVLLESACLGLLAAGDQSALAEACIARARAMGGEVASEEIFGPVTRLLDSGVATVVRLEALLAEGRFHEAHKNDQGKSMVSYREAATVVNRIASGLNDTDRAALRIHPWSREIRRGLGLGRTS